MSATVPALFQPARIGRLKLKHRVVLAPLTRFRNTKSSQVPIAFSKEYYTQRASTPGTLLITEGTMISLEAGGYDNLPGIWSDEQINAWEEIVEAVHSKDSFIYLQIAAMGRAAMASVLEANNLTLIGPSPIPLSSQPLPIPKELSKNEIQAYVQQFVTAAKNAVFRAGFDGVEIHGANGVLIDQFLQDISNQRTDEYGGSIENRTRFALEVTKAVAEAIGEDRTAFRISPWNTHQELGMANPVPQFSHVTRELKAAHPNLAYLHVIEPRWALEEGVSITHVNPSNDFIRNIWAPKPLITAGGYSRETAIQMAQDKGDLIAFGRHFIANPDLPKRLLNDLSLNKYDRLTFYTTAEMPNADIGYTDYPFYNDKTNGLTLVPP